MTGALRDQDLALAGPVGSPDPDAGGAGRPTGWARFLWSQLTSMRTALVLLFALALAAIPGSLVPQRPANPLKVADFVAANPELGQWYDRLGLFDVYASPWFAAVYLLLFVSLAGCIVPRVAIYARALRAQPPATPRRLARLPGHRTFAGSSPASAALDAAAAHLSARRFRIRRDAESLSAERGYLREFGNLLFHGSLVCLLCGLAWGSLWGYKGTVSLVEGEAFSDTISQFDDFSAGAAFSPDQLPAFTVWLDEFAVRFETGPIQRGAARLFDAKVHWAATGDPQPADLQVNQPLDLEGTAVHLVGHGYAPVVTVRGADGKVAFAGPVVFLPQDGNFTSTGVIKVPDARPQRLAFEGLFLPTAVMDANGPHSVFPDALGPELYLNVWSGPPRVETGRPESVYVLDKTGLTQVRSAAGDLVRLRLLPGSSVDLPGGGSITFDSWRRWTRLQVSRTPGLWLVLLSVLIAVAGLCLSLYVRPRRVWVRVTPDHRVEIAGLDRTEGRGGLDAELQALAAALAAASDAGDTSTIPPAAEHTSSTGNQPASDSEDDA